MILHYLKIAFRNLTKYKTQTIISVIGLAVGFVCFALSTLWIRYERSFDRFHPNAEHLYITYSTGGVFGRGMGLTAPYAYEAYVRATFPEVRNATTMFTGEPQYLEFEHTFAPFRKLRIRENFFDMFDIRILQGQLPFYSHTNIAISARRAQQLFGNENPIGKTAMLHNTEFTITAVVSDWAGPSNFSFDFLYPMQSWPPERAWMMWIGNVVFELYPTVDEEAFLERFRNHVVRPEQYAGNFNLTFEAIPLTSLRTNDELITDKNVRHQFIVWFSLIGLLVIACALFNYFTLFFSRFRIRKREFALRMVYGANTKSLFALLAVEFVLVLVIAASLGLLLVSYFQHIFWDLSGVDLPLSAILVEMSVYFASVILFALLLFTLLLFIFRKTSLNAAIRRRKNANSRRISVVGDVLN